MTVANLTAIIDIDSEEVQDGKSFRNVLRLATTLRTQRLPVAPE